MKKRPYEASEIDDQLESPYKKQHVRSIATPRPPLRQDIPLKNSKPEYVSTVGPPRPVPTPIQSSNASSSVSFRTSSSSLSSTTSSSSAPPSSQTTILSLLQSSYTHPIAMQRPEKPNRPMPRALSFPVPRVDSQAEEDAKNGETKEDNSKSTKEVKSGEHKETKPAKKEDGKPPVVLPRVAVHNQDFYQCTYEEAKQDPKRLQDMFEQFGVVAVRMFDEKFCDKVGNGFWDTLEEGSITSVPLRRDKPETWQNEAFPQQLAVGIVKQCMGQTSSLGAQQVISHPALQHVFRILYRVHNDEPLLSSFDTLRMTRGQEYDREANLSWYHIDQNNANSILQQVPVCVQAQVLLTKQQNPLAHGSFSFFPKSHKFVRDHIQRYGGKQGLNIALGTSDIAYDELTENFLRIQKDCPLLQTKPCILSLSRGTVLFWASDVVHANWPAVQRQWISGRTDFVRSLPAEFRDKKHLLEGQLRSMVYFISMMPRSIVEQIMAPLFQSPKKLSADKARLLPRDFASYLQQRRRFFLDGLTSPTHWIPIIPLVSQGKVVNFFYPLRRVYPVQARAINKINFQIAPSSIYEDEEELRERSPYAEGVLQLLPLQ